MSCGHTFDKETISAAIQRTFSTKYNHQINCPRQRCGKSWDIDECYTAIDMSDEHYEYYLDQIEKRTSQRDLTHNYGYGNYGNHGTSSYRSNARKNGYPYGNDTRYNSYPAAAHNTDPAYNVDPAYDANKQKYTNQAGNVNESEDSNHEQEDDHKYKQGQDKGKKDEKKDKKRDHKKDDSNGSTKGRKSMAPSSNNNNNVHNKFLGNDDHSDNQDIKMKETNTKTNGKKKTNSGANRYQNKDSNMINMKDVDDTTQNDDYKDEKNDTKTDKKTTNKGKNSKKDKNSSKNNKKNGRKSAVKSLPQMGNGIVGLSNLGNTCFMNSALQCLLQSPEFVGDFFYDKVKLPTTTTSSRWGYSTTTSVNKSSISYIWSEFIKEIYTTNCRSTSPRNIKWALNRLNSDIGNGSQEDAFNVIETLLDGLDEELCPNADDIEEERHITEEKDIPSEEEIEQIKQRLWSLYTKKSKGNCPIVRERFDGIECEILTCPDCNYQYRAFHKFRHIQLPLLNKSIKINITVYIPEIEEFRSIPLRLELAFDNTCDGLKYIVLAQIKDTLLKNKLSKESVDVQFGYYHPSNGNQSNDVNKWIKFMDDDGNCAKIKDYCGLFAVVYKSNNDDGDNYGEYNNNPANNKFQFIPTYNLIVTEDDQWGSNIDTLTFTKINSSRKSVSGKKFIDHLSNVSVPGLEEYNAPIIYYNNHLVSDDPNNSVKITKKGCLLRIWIHSQYRKKSPANVKLNLDENDTDIIQRALQQQKSSSRGMSMGYIMDTLYDYYTKLTCFDLSAFIPGYNMNDNREKIQNEKSNAQSVYNKLKELSESEKLANKWLRMRINGIKKNNEKKGINYTKPKMLDNVSECLKVYEMKETSDGVGVDCPVCDNVPDIASREVDIIKTPQILLINIDREQTDFSGADRSRKRDNLIEYPIKDLQFSSDKYDLFGVVEHSGYGTQWGHYVCYVKSLRNQNWYKMNDSSTSRVNHSSSVITKDATVLLYRKKDKKSNQIKAEN